MPTNKIDVINSKWLSYSAFMCTSSKSYENDTEKIETAFSDKVNLLERACSEQMIFSENAVSILSLCLYLTTHHLCFQEKDTLAS